ncbi:Cytochrome P450 [Hoeflea phototrophica DFL-43]|uniref:Cytochrome P450 n=1 Tax=Hoeflea phototrophica (strain DSM 17068 / NCIMB 14078 / DFL-43) TaxID=411684 RepID=A9CV26_HOEPD|nr:cytochrome P450 [Hoeflea phototrophica]EDQ35314.2 Cytochrome P450 [Hoeflea phototrophica DFL-43]
MLASASPFVPPAPVPRTKPPSRFEIIRTVMRNPLELWGEPSFRLKWMKTKFFNERTLIANHPGLVRHVLVDNAQNYRMATIRQLILRPILRDGLLTAEGETWKRSRKAMAPVFTPRHARGFAEQMLAQSQAFKDRYVAAVDSNSGTGDVRDIAVDMTELTFDILSATLFSGHVAGSEEEFAGDIERLLSTMGQVDPMDLLKAPRWIPRIRRMFGQKVLDKFRAIVKQTMDDRQKMMRDEPDAVPEDFLTLLIRLHHPAGLTLDEIEDNIITFIGAGHETTARALGWTLYCLANSPADREKVEAEIDEVIAREPDPVKWLDQMPWTRAVFEEAMRLYPPAPSINRAAITDDSWQDEKGETVTIEAGTTVLVMPWTLHRHTLLWDRPEAFIPSRFLPENRGSIDRYQYLPFGVGPRICIGATFALQEAVIALGALLSEFRFDCVAETKPWPVQKLTTQPEGGLPMRVSRRQGNASR